MGYSIIGSDGQAFSESLEGAKQVNFGKTKKVFRRADGTFAISHEDVLTAYDNPDFTGIAPGKGIASAYSSAVLFKRIEEAGVKTSHLGVINPNTTHERPLDMLPLEVIWRRYNVEGNSWEGRNPGQVPVGQKYDSIKYEVGLKWSVIDGQTGEECTDPFMMLDENFQPLVTSQGLPRLIHQKKGHEIMYSKVMHPNKKHEILIGEVLAAMEQYRQYASEIREMAEKVQEVTFDTYAQIGRLNADGKIEVGLNSEGNLTLGDELELDALRNVSLEKIETDDNNLLFEEDLIGHDLNELIKGGARAVNRILKSRHSGKQAYRDRVKMMKDEAMSEDRQAANNLAAKEVTDTIYVPVAQALSDKFGEKVGLILQLA